MTYARFEEVPVWEDAMRLAEGVYALTENRQWPGTRSLRDQMERAALSVSNNIAEGFERGTTKELLSFLYIARGSAGEVRSMLCFIERRYGNLRFQISNLKSKAVAQKAQSTKFKSLNPQSQISNFESQIPVPVPGPDLKSEISNLKLSIPDHKPQISNPSGTNPNFSESADLKSQISNPSGTNPNFPESADLKSQISNLKSLAESCSRQLRAWADHLQNSEITGQRHLNQKTKNRYLAQKEVQAFEQELLDHLPPEHPLRKARRGI